ncbi:hypothetical protein SBY92_000664 [Candida maltosa Xu316]
MQAEHSNHSSESFDPDTYKRSQSTIKDQPKIKPDMVLNNFERSYEQPPLGGYQKFIASLGRCFGTCGLFCCLCENPYKEVDQGEVGLVQTFGALTRTVEPGLSYVNTWSEKLTKVSIKINIREIPAQRCFTKDNVSVTITSVVYYNILDPMKAIFNISNIHEAIIERTQTTLRDVIGGRSLQDVVEKREEIAEAIEEIISKTASDWGVNIENLTLADKVMASLSMATEAKRLGEAKIISAKADIESAKLMRRASQILSSKAAMNIRYLEAFQNVAKTAGAKVIFMPSAHEIERLSEGSFDHQASGKDKQVDLDLDQDWNDNSPGLGNNRTIANNIALQESIRE